MSNSKPLISAFTPPPNGWIHARKDGKIYDKKFIEDFRTVERYKEYKACGFDEIIFAGEDKYVGEEYSTSQLKKMLDTAHEADLKAIVFDERILSATVRAQSQLVGELFESEDQLDDFIRECVKDYSLHPAFYGVSIIDEPFIAKKKVIHDIAKAFKRVLPSAFVHTCFNPLSCVEGGPMQEVVLGPGKNGYDAYGKYIDAMSVPELGYFGYDDYPFKWWEGVPAVEKYVTTMQFVARRCLKNDIPFHMTIQSYAGNSVDKKGKRYDLTQGHFDFLVNLALGFGVEKLYYYTYWRFSTRSKLDAPDLAIMNEDGSKNWYDQVQKSNTLFRKTREHLEGFKYVDSEYFSAPMGSPVVKDFVSHPLKVFSEVESDFPLLFNKFEKDTSTLYMLQNMASPYEKKYNQLHLKFIKPRTSVDAIVNGRRKSVIVHNNELLFILAPGEAVWFFDL